MFVQCSDDGQGIHSRFEYQKDQEGFLNSFGEDRFIIFLFVSQQYRTRYHQKDRNRDLHENRDHDMDALDYTRSFHV